MEGGKLAGCELESKERWTKKRVATVQLEFRQHRIILQGTAIFRCPVRCCSHCCHRIPNTSSVKEEDFISLCLRVLLPVMAGKPQRREFPTDGHVTVHMGHFTIHSQESKKRCALV